MQRGAQDEAAGKKEKKKRHWEEEAGEQTAAAGMGTADAVVRSSVTCICWAVRFLHDRVAGPPGCLGSDGACFVAGGRAATKEAQKGRWQEPEAVLRVSCRDLKCRQTVGGLLSELAMNGSLFVRTCSVPEHDDPTLTFRISYVCASNLHHSRRTPHRGKKAVDGCCSCKFKSSVDFLIRQPHRQTTPKPIIVPKSHPLYGSLWQSWLARQFLLETWGTGF